MKKCSTAALLLAASLGMPAHAGQSCEFAPDAPDEHRIQRGDTLWDIASLFLQNPWCWTRVWESNREQVANPHRIYPGQRIVLDRQAGRLRTIGPGATAPTGGRPAEVRLTPLARSSALPTAQAIPVVSPSLLEGAVRFRLVTATAIANAARIVGLADGRRMAGPGDTVLVEGMLRPGTDYEVVRPLGPVRDPDHRHTLALPLLRIGVAGEQQLHTAGLYHVRIGSARAEITAGDLLLPLPAPRTTPSELLPAAACNGKVAALLREGERGGKGDVVLINRGREAGLDSGSLVAVTKHVRIGADDSHPASTAISRPSATLLVFDVHAQSALALVLQSEDTISAGDSLGTLPAPD